MIDIDPWQYDTADKVKVLATYLIREFDEKRHFFDWYDYRMKALEKSFDEFRHEHAMRLADKGEG